MYQKAFVSSSNSAGSTSQMTMPAIRTVASCAVMITRIAFRLDDGSLMNRSQARPSGVRLFDVDTFGSDDAAGSGWSRRAAMGRLRLSVGPRAYRFGGSLRR